MQQKGKVWLVGAGPGDAGLITIKAKNLIEQADVIVYDALVSTEIIGMLPFGCEKINVGKRSSHHIASQEEINQLLLKLAMQGKQVVRLKGGDPFVFGRGGEELELLAEHDIPYEIVPGITSAVAVPAYAGIPVTHRDYTSSFHIITGHERADKKGNSQIPFESLVKLNATLVFLMGISNLKMICDGLLRAGMPADMPAAVLENGTNACQRKVISSLSRLKEDADKAKIQTPAIIVVGKVCQLSSVFQWAEERVLGGKQFIVTRPQTRSSALTEPLRSMGAQVIEMPAIQTTPLQNDSIRSALLTIGKKEYEEEWIVFTSPVGVTYFFAYLNQEKMDLRTFFRGTSKIRFAVIGSGTAKELAQHGIMADVVPEKYNAEELAKAIVEKAGKNSRAMILRAKEGSKLLLPILEEAGMICQDIPVYETILQKNEVLSVQITSLIENGRIDGITFTSASTVKGFVQAMGEKADISRILAICIGEQTMEEAKKHGMRTIVSKESSIESMLSLIRKHFGK